MQQKFSTDMNERLNTLKLSSDFICIGSDQIEIKANSLSNQSKQIKTSAEKFQI